MASSNPPLYPLSPSTTLTSTFKHQSLAALPTPAIVLDRALIRRNCAAMLGICAELGVGFRAHVKSHKTLELARLQVGDEGEGGEKTWGKGGGGKKANFIVSTVMEAEQLVGYVRGVQEKGWEGSVCIKILSSSFVFYFALVGFYCISHPLASFAFSTLCSSSVSFIYLSATLLCANTIRLDTLRRACPAIQYPASHKSGQTTRPRLRTRLA